MADTKVNKQVIHLCTMRHELDVLYDPQFAFVEQ